MKTLNFLITTLFLISLFSCRAIPQDTIEEHSINLESKVNSEKTSSKVDDSGFYFVKNYDNKSLTISNKNELNSFLILLEHEIDVKMLEKLQDDNYKVIYGRDYLILSTKINTYIFNIIDNDYALKSKDIRSFDNSIIFNTIGISRVFGKEKTKTLKSYNPYFAPPEYGGGDLITCTSGGPGASQCAVHSGIGPAENGCEVTCKNGYYACCDDGRTICKCVKEK